MKYILLFCAVLAIKAEAQLSLLLIGGGKRTPVALSAWIQTSQNVKPKVMIITWASEIQSEVEEAIQNDFKQIGVVDFLSSQSITAKNRSQFLMDLKMSTHIFFSGGDQKRIMNVLNDTEILEALKNAYWQNLIPVAGTSAGTAVQGELMIQGENLPLVPGLGFLPQTVTDQHFFKRQREPRLRAALDRAPQYFVGLGVDEDGAILLQRDPQTLQFKSEVLGDKNILYIDQELNGNRIGHILKSLK